MPPHKNYIPRLKVFRAKILRHGLIYDAIIATKNKTELRQMFNLAHRQLWKWTVSRMPLEVKTANKNPRKLMARLAFVNDDEIPGSYVEIDNNFTTRESST
jgi:hypothetical protein